MCGMSFKRQQSARYVSVFSFFIALLAGVSLYPSLAHAHGMNAAEMAPPIITAGILAFVCYWLVVLWPASKGAETGLQWPPETDRAIRIKRKPRLRVIETKPQLPDEQPESRQVADG